MPHPSHPLITRSIGLGFVHAFLEKDYTVIAAVRDVSKMPKTDKVITVRIASDSKTDAKEVRNAQTPPLAHDESWVVRGMTKRTVLGDEGAPVESWDYATRSREL